MDSGNLVVGNIAVSAVVIKTLISAYKQMFSLSANVTKISAVVLGVICAFLLQTNMFDIENTNIAIVVFQRLISGAFIGATAMGFHETIKNVNTTKPSGIK